MGLAKLVVGYKTDDLLCTMSLKELRGLEGSTVQSDCGGIVLGFHGDENQITGADLITVDYADSFDIDFLTQVAKEFINPLKDFFSVKTPPEIFIVAETESGIQ